MTVELVLDSSQKLTILSSLPCSEHLSGRHSPFFLGYWSELSLGIKWSDKADHSLLSGAEIKSPWSFSSSPSYLPMIMCLIKHRDTSFLPSAIGRAHVANWEKKILHLVWEWLRKKNVMCVCVCVCRGWQKTNQLLLLKYVSEHLMVKSLLFVKAFCDGCNYLKLQTAWRKEGLRTVVNIITRRGSHKAEPTLRISSVPAVVHFSPHFDKQSSSTDFLVLHDLTFLFLWTLLFKQDFCGSAHCKVCR
jgi:hypothetical protein